jgi:hypothetical protein
MFNTSNVSNFCRVVKRVKLRVKPAITRGFYPRVKLLRVKRVKRVKPILQRRQFDPDKN